MTPPFPNGDTLARLKAIEEEQADVKAEGWVDDTAERFIYEYVPFLLSVIRSQGEAVKEAREALAKYDWKEGTDTIFNNDPSVARNALSKLSSPTP